MLSYWFTKLSECVFSRNSGLALLLLLLFSPQSFAVGPSQLAPTTIDSISGGGANITDPDISGSDWVMFAPGNGAIIEGMLEAIKVITDDGGYNTLITIILTVGVLVLAVQLGSNVKPHQIITYLLGAWFILYIMFALKVDIEIIDSVNDDVTAAQVHTVVTGVPAAIGFPAAAASQIGFWLTELMELNFPIPAMARVSSGASFGIMASLPGDLTKLRFTDSYIRASLNRFLTDCIIPDVSTGTIPSNTLIQSEDLWTLFANNANGKFSTYSVIYSAANPQGLVRPCATVANQIGAALPGEANSLIIQMSDVWHQNNSLVQMTQTIDQVMDSIQGTDVALPAAGIAVQAALINAWNEAYKNAAVATNNNELLVALNFDQAEKVKSTGWASSSTLFKDVMGYLHAVLTAFCLALGPLVLLAVLVPGMAKTLGKTYLSMMLWLALWYPVLSVLNFLVSEYAIRAMGDLLAWQANGVGVSVSGISLSTYTEIAMRSAKHTMLGNMVSSSVPLWLWGMFKGGGHAMASFIDKGVSGGAVAGFAGPSTAASGSGARLPVDYDRAPGGGGNGTATNTSVQHSSVSSMSDSFGSGGINEMGSMVSAISGSALSGGAFAGSAMASGAMIGASGAAAVSTMFNNSSLGSNTSGGASSGVGGSINNGSMNSNATVNIEGDLNSFSNASSLASDRDLGGLIDPAAGIVQGINFSGGQVEVGSDLRSQSAMDQFAQETQKIAMSGSPATMRSLEQAMSEHFETVMQQANQVQLAANGGVYDMSYSEKSAFMEQYKTELARSMGEYSSTSVSTPTSTATSIGASTSMLTGTQNTYGKLSGYQQDFTAQLGANATENFGGVFDNTNIPASAFSKLSAAAESGELPQANIWIVDQMPMGIPSNALAAYDSDSQTILVSQSLVDQSKNNPELLARAMGEEFGHHVDNLLRNEYSNVGGDTTLDEGALFARDYLGFTVTDAEVAFDGRDGSYEYFQASEHQSMGEKNHGIVFKNNVDFSSEDLYRSNWLLDMSNMYDEKGIEGLAATLAPFIVDRELQQSESEKEPGDVEMTPEKRALAVKEREAATAEKAKVISDDIKETLAQAIRYQYYQKFGVELDVADIPVYAAVQHIDNPVETVEELKSTADKRTGVAKHIVQSEEYINVELQRAFDAGSSVAGAGHLSLASHPFEDLASHSNFIELSMQRELDKIPGNAIQIENWSTDTVSGDRPIFTTGAFGGSDAGFSMAPEFANIAFPEGDGGHSHDSEDMKQIYKVIRGEEGETLPDNASIERTRKYMELVEKDYAEVFKENPELVGAIDTALSIKQGMGIIKDNLPAPLAFIGNAISGAANAGINAADEAIPMVQSLRFDPDKDIVSHSQLSKDHKDHPIHQLAFDIAQTAEVELWSRMNDAWTLKEQGKDEEALAKLSEAQEWVSSYFSHPEDQADSKITIMISDYVNDPDNQETLERLQYRSGLHQQAAEFTGQTPDEINGALSRLTENATEVGQQLSEGDSDGVIRALTETGEQAYKDFKLQEIEDDVRKDIHEFNEQTVQPALEQVISNANELRSDLVDAIDNMELANSDTAIAIIDQALDKASTSMDATTQLIAQELQAAKDRFQSGEYQQAAEDLKESVASEISTRFSSFVDDLSFIKEEITKD